MTIPGRIGISIYYDPVESIAGEPTRTESSTLLLHSKTTTIAVESLGAGMTERMVAGAFILLTVLSGIYTISMLRVVSMAIWMPSLKLLALLTATMVASGLLTLGGLQVVRRSARTAVLLAAGTVPIATLSGGAWCLQTRHLWMGMMLMAVGLWALWCIAQRRQRERLETTADIICIAADALTMHAVSIFSVSGFLAIVISLYCWLWTITFRTMPHNALNLIIAGMALLWTVGVVECCQRYVIGRCVASHYYSPSSSVATGGFEALGRALSPIAFGQICILGGLRLVIRLFRLGIDLYKFSLSILPVGPVRSVLLSGIPVSSWIESRVLQISDHSLHYVALTDSSLLGAARSIIRVFRRNLITILLTDASTTAILFFLPGNLSMAIVASVAILLHWSIPSVALFCFLGLIAMNLFASILTAAIDASLVCYAMDLDDNKMHVPAVHQAFAARLALLHDESNAINV